MSLPPSGRKTAEGLNIQHIRSLHGRASSRLYLGYFTSPGARKHNKEAPRRSRGFFICGHSPTLLACVSRHASTICQPRKICYLPPENGFRNFPLSVVLLPCPPLVGGGCILLFSLHSFLPYPRNTLYTRTPDSGTYILAPGTSHRSSSCFSLSDTP